MEPGTEDEEEAWLNVEVLRLRSESNELTCAMRRLEVGADVAEAIFVKLQLPLREREMSLDDGKADDGGSSVRCWFLIWLDDQLAGWPMLSLSFDAFTWIVTSPFSDELKKWKQRVRASLGIRIFQSHAFLRLHWAFSFESRPETAIPVVPRPKAKQRSASDSQGTL